MIQAIFQLLFNLPVSTAKPLFFGSLCSELLNKFFILGNEKREEFLNKIQNSLQLLFMKAKDLDRESREILLEFMTCFIFEREFKFDFEFIKEKLEDPAIKVLTVDLIHRFQKISFIKNLQKALPEFLHDLLV